MKRISELEVNENLFTARRRSAPIRFRSRRATLRRYFERRHPYLVQVIIAQSEKLATSFSERSSEKSALPHRYKKYK